MSKIRSTYTHGLKQCFQKVLKGDPNAAGTIKLKFTVGERGDVTKATLEGFGYAELDACVETKVMTWRFSAPKDADGEATTMTVKVSLPFSGA
jgi:TonB family protein